MRRSLVVSLALLAIVRAPAVAQTCQGLASFSTGQMQATGNATFGNGMDTFGATLAYGQPAGAFGGIGIGTTSIDAFDGSSFDVGVAGGYQMTAGKAKKIHLCPVANFGLGMGPKDVGGSGVDMSTTTGGMGLALGTSLPGGPRMQIIPTGGLGLEYLKFKADNGTTSSSASDTYGVMNLGVGFIFNSQIAVRPGISIPLGLDGGETSFGLTVGYNFGNKGARTGRRH
jgi:outer membrane protein with beta-barrel domain